MAGLWMMLLSFSRTRSLHWRICLRMAYSSGLAWSEISSSLRMADAISSSRRRNVESSDASAVMRGVFSRSVTSVSRAARAARMQEATSSRARGDSVAPMAASFSEGRTSSKATSGCCGR